MERESARHRTHLLLSRSSPTSSRTHLAIQVQQIESKQVNFDLDILGLDVLPLPPTKFLEGKETFLIFIPSDSFGVDHEGSGAVRCRGVDGLCQLTRTLVRWHEKEERDFVWKGRRSAT